eukprot:Gb_13421 [translate_table: standard]
MSSSGRADGRTGTPRDVFSMPRDYSYPCMSDISREKRRERDGFTKRLSSSISLDGGTSGSPSKRRAAGVDSFYSGRSGGISSNGWHEDVLSRSKSLLEIGTHGGNYGGAVAPSSPRLECSGGDGSPKELDGYRISKPISPFAQTRSSPFVHVSYNSFAGKGVLAREYSRCSEWESPYKMDMDFRDKIWGKSELHKRAGSSTYETATALSMHKEIDGRREDGRQDGYGGSGDSTGGSGYHTRSYQEWRHVDRVASSLLPLRTHTSSNGHMKESGARAQGIPDVLGAYSSTWYSPLSSPVNHTTDGGRDDGSQTSPRKRPRLGWGQGLAKYEKKIIGGAEDSLAAKGRMNSCSEEILLSHSDSLHQGAGHGQEVSSAKAPVDSTIGPCFEIDKDNPTVQMDQTETMGSGSITEKNRDLGSMPASVLDRLDSGQSSDALLVSKDYGNTETSVQPQVVFSGQVCNEDATARLKTNILQRLEKLELEVERTEKELAKVEVPPEMHIWDQNDCVVDVAGNLVVVEAQPQMHLLGERDCMAEVPKSPVVGAPVQEVIEEIGMPPVGAQQTSSCLLAKSDFQSQPSCEVKHLLPSSSLSMATGICKGDNDTLEGTKDDLQCRSLQDGSPSASFSEAEEITAGADSRDTHLQSLSENDEILLENINVKSVTLCTMENSECWKVLYDSNREEAKCASEVLANLLPDPNLAAGMAFYDKPEDIPAWKKNMKSNERIKQKLHDILVQEKLFLTFREHVLALKYRALRETWKHEQAGLCQWSDRTEGFRKWDVERRNGTLVPTQRTSHRLRLSVSGTSKVDAASDEIQTMQKLLAEPFGVYQRPHLKMPCQILDEKERRMQRFITNNSLIEDPLAFEQERKTINPWMPEEKKIFLDTFFVYNKNFQKIASLIEHKTVADCIEFYYRNQKSEEFEMVRRRQQLKNRRDYSRPSNYLATTTPPSNRRREITAISVDMLPTPATMALYNDNGRVFRSGLSKNSHSNHLGSVDSSSLDKAPGNLGLVIGRNVPTEHSNKIKDAQTSRSLTSNTEEFDSQWTDHERQLFVSALGIFGKDFGNISQHVATKSEGQCKAFFSKTRKRLGLDQVLETFETNMHEHFDTRMVGDTEDLNTAASVEDSKSVDIGGGLMDVKDVKGTRSDECLSLACDVKAAIISSNSTEELLVTELKSKSSENGRDDQITEDEKQGALFTELKNDIPEIKTEKVSSCDIEERIEKEEKNISPFLIELLSAPKNESDPLGVTAESIPDAGADVECVDDTMVQLDVHNDECLSNSHMPKFGMEDGAQVSPSVLDAFERPVSEGKELQVDVIDQITQECPNVTQSSYSNSYTTCAAPITANTSVTHPTRARGNASGGESKPRREATSWTQDEKEKFVEIIRKHGRDWSLLQENLPAKSLTQIKTYFQNSKAKLGFTSGEGTTNIRNAATRKHKVDDSDSSSTLYHLAHHKAASLSDDSGLKSDQVVNSSPSTMLGIPASDGLSFTLFGKGTWQAEDPNIFTGVQKIFHHMYPNGYTQQGVTGTGLFPVFHPSTLPVFAASGFQQPQNLNLQPSLSYSTSSKPQLVAPQQTQQISALQQQTQSSSALCNLQSQELHQIKQQQKTPQVVAHAQQDYQNQGIQQLQKWVMQHQALQSLQQNVSSAVQPQLQPQLQVVLQQHNQQQHLSQSSYHMQQAAMNQNLHYLEQQPSLQSLGQLTTVASQQMSSNYQKTINQQQLPNQQQLMNQFHPHQHGENQQKQYNVLQNQVSQQQQHFLLGSSQEHLAFQLHHQQQHLQSEKQLQSVLLPLHTRENSEGQALDTLSEKDHKQRHDLHREACQIVSKDVSMISDSIESRNVPRSQQHEGGHFQDSQVNVQVLANSQPKTVFFPESHQTRTGDVKLFGQFLLSQPTSSVNSAACTSSNVFSQPTFSLSSVPVNTVAGSVSEVLPDTYPDGTSCLPSGFGRIGISFSQGQGLHVPWQSASGGSFGAWNRLLDVREQACLAKGTDYESDMQNSQTVGSRPTQRLTREAKECDNSRSEGSSSQIDVGEQLRRLQDGQNLVQSFGIKTVTDQSSSLGLHPGDLNGSNLDLKSDILQELGVTDLSGMLSRSKVSESSSTPGTLMGAPLRSSQSLPCAVVDALLAIAGWHSAHELRNVGSCSSEEQHQNQDSQRNNAGDAVEVGKSGMTISQAPPLVQSFAGGTESPQFTRDNSFFGQQAILQASGNSSLNVSLWGSTAGVVQGSDLQRVIVPAVSSVWSRGSIVIEGQPRPADSREAEDSNEGIP